VLTVDGTGGKSLQFDMLSPRLLAKLVTGFENF